MPASRKRRQQIALKQWPTFFLIIAGLSFVLYF